MTKGTLYLDLYNNWNNEDNIVNIGNLTSYPTAQTWQYRFDGTDYKIMPLKSPTRSLSFHDNALHITSVSNIQNWRPELISNGKYVFDGKYKIKLANSDVNQYLKRIDNDIKLSNSGTTWIIESLDNNYYSITCLSAASSYYFNLVDNADEEGKAVRANISTQADDAKTWKIMMKNNGNVIIVPKVSLTRGIKSTTTGSTLSTSKTEFRLIKVYY